MDRVRRVEYLLLDALYVALVLSMLLVLLLHPVPRLHGCRDDVLRGWLVSDALALEHLLLLLCLSLQLV